MAWGEQRKPTEAEQTLKKVKKILKEEDKGIVNTPRLLERLQKALNYKES